MNKTFRTSSPRSNRSNSPQIEQIKVTENDICEYIRLLEQINNNDKKNISEIISKIDSECLQNRMKIALIFSEIVLKLGVDNSIIILSIKWICKIFTPESSTSQDNILLEWYSCDPKTKEKIKIAIFKGLSFNDPQILSLTSLALSSLIKIEKTQTDILTRLYTTYESQSSSNLTKSASINVLAEICREKTLNGYSDSNDPLNNLTQKVYEKIIEYFTSDITSQTIDIRFNLTAAIDTFIEPDLIKKKINEVKKSIIDNLQNIPVNKPSNSIAYPEQLHYKLLSVLFKIICMNYDLKKVKDNDKSNVILDILKKISREGFEHETVEQLVENGFDHELIFGILENNFKPKMIRKMIKQGISLNFLKHALHVSKYILKIALRHDNAEMIKDSIRSNIYNENDDIDDFENDFEIFVDIIGVRNGLDSDDDDDNNSTDSDDDDNNSTDSDDDDDNDNNNNNNNNENEILADNELFNLILKQILEFNCTETNQFIISNLLQFLNSLIKFENKEIQKNMLKENLKNVMHEGIRGKGRVSYYVKEEKIKNFYKIELDKIVNKLLSILNTKIDDLNTATTTTHKYALMCLQSYFQTDPIKIFAIIKNYWTEEMKDYFKLISNPQQKTNWVNDYAFILSISVICQQTNYSEDIKSIIQSFLITPIENNFSIIKDFIVCKCLTVSKIPKILDACLYCLSSIFNEYPDFLNDDIYDHIFNWINQNKEIKDPNIFYRILNLISSIFTTRDNSKLNEYISMKLTTSFNFIIELFQIGIRKPDSFEEKKIRSLDQTEKVELGKESYSMMMSVIIYTLQLNNNSIDENISKLISSIILILKEKPGNDNEIFEKKITNLLCFLSNIFDYKNAEKFSHFLEEIIESCFILMDPNLKFFKIFEFAIGSFSSFVTFLDETKMKLIKKMDEYATLGLTSGNPKITVNSAILRCKILYKIITSKFTNYSTYVSQISIIYDSIIESCLTDFDITKENYPTLFISIIYLILSCKDYQNENPTFIKYVMSLFDTFAKMPISIKKDDENDLKQADFFFYWMFNLASHIINCLQYNTSFCDQFFDNFVPNFLKLMEFNVSDRSLKALCYFIRFCYMKGTRTILKRNTNLIILYHGLCSKNPNIKKRARSTLEMIL